MPAAKKPNVRKSNKLSKSTKQSKKQIKIWHDPPPPQPLRFLLEVFNTPADASINMMRRFMRYEAAGGLMLVMASLLAIIVANSQWKDFYYVMQHIHVRIGFEPILLDKSLQHFVNDGLMAIFFLLVGLEIKREFVAGELASFDQAILPLVAAVCGMAIPAIIYAGIVTFNGQPDLLHGWAIPAATDIAFAIGIMALAGKRMPLSVKILLVAIAIIDDLGAILVIAIFYTVNLSFQALFFALLSIFILYWMNKRNITMATPYVIVGTFLWLFVLQSGVHATLAGVATAFAIPLRSKNKYGDIPLHNAEKALEPWVNFGILPLFGFLNAGLYLGGFDLGIIYNPLVLAIVCGLFFGKQIGIFGSLWLMIKLGIGRMPKGADWQHIYAMSVLCGIGFTISLFIGELAFSGSEHTDTLRIGVFVGSILSAGIGYLLVRVMPHHGMDSKKPKVKKPAAKAKKARAAKPRRARA